MYAGKATLLARLWAPRVQAYSSLEHHSFTSVYLPERVEQTHKGRLIMRRTTAFILAAMLSSSAAIPATAAWDPVGSVNFTNRDTHDAKLGNFKGTAVGLTARDSDVMCDSVTATFGDGRSREIFRGELPRGQTIRVGLPGAQRSIDRVDFDCRPMDGRRATVDIAADDGRGFGYREQNLQNRDYYAPRQRTPDYYSRQQGQDYYGRQQPTPDYYSTPQSPNYYGSQTPDYDSNRQTPDYYGSQNPDPYRR
jgi:hypothetical protein